jgi:hypothetical protein
MSEGQEVDREADASDVLFDVLNFVFNGVFLWFYNGIYYYSYQR